MPSPATPAPTIIVAGKSYPLAWGTLAQNRYASMPEEVKALSYPANDLYVAWSAIAAIPNPFPSWEHLAQHITLQEMPALSKALNELFPPQTEEKKSETSSSAETGPSPDSALA